MNKGLGTRLYSLYFAMVFSLSLSVFCYGTVIKIGYVPGGIPWHLQFSYNWRLIWDRNKSWQSEQL
jgi:hypothetical protein